MASLVTEGQASIRWADVSAVVRAAVAWHLATATPGTPRSVVIDRERALHAAVAALGYR